MFREHKRGPKDAAAGEASRLLDWRVKRRQLSRSIPPECNRSAPRHASLEVAFRSAPNWHSPAPPACAQLPGFFPASWLRWQPSPHHWVKPPVVSITIAAAQHRRGEIRVARLALPHRVRPRPPAPWLDRVAPVIPPRRAQQWDPPSSEFDLPVQKFSEPFLPHVALRAPHQLQSCRKRFYQNGYIQPRSR